MTYFERVTRPRIKQLKSPLEHDRQRHCDPFASVTVTGRFANVQFANVLSRFANVLSQFANVL